jgi:diguanylate cyclase (GGDEF)-like protein
MRELRALPGPAEPAAHDRRRAGRAPGRGLLLMLAAAASVAGALVLAAARLGTPSLLIPAACLAVASGVRTLMSIAGGRPAASGGRPADLDDLTGLLGRRAFLDEASDAASPGCALLLVDIDRFRDVNDTLGHDEGDRFLRAVGHRLRRAVGDDGLLGRLGGDEFAVLVARGGRERAERLAGRLREALRPPLRLAGMPVPASASVGIALAPAHGSTVAELLARAERAMYEAKREHSGARVFDSACPPPSPARLRMRAELASAFEQAQLELRYQPKADLGSGRITGVEALVRWHHPTDGMQSPEVFLPEMEHAGLMSSLTERVLDLALDDCARWRAAGAWLTVSVNAPASVIVEEAFVGVVRDALARRGLEPGALTVEVTEDGLMTAMERAQRTLAGLRELGVRVSLDDYGTGFCSLAYLHELPADELKLDKSFLADLERSASAMEIVRSTVGLAHALDLRIIAEGVESARSWEALAGWGCDEAQGYFVSPPLPARDVLAWLQEWSQRLRPALREPDGAAGHRRQVRHAPPPPDRAVRGGAVRHGHARAGRAGVDRVHHLPASAFPEHPVFPEHPAFPEHPVLPGYPALQGDQALPGHPTLPRHPAHPGRLGG